MHNREMVWKTSDGRSLKLKDITTAHLCNISKYINENLDNFISKYGEEIANRCKYNINQEIRYRKLNRIKNNDFELF